MKALTEQKNLFMQKNARKWKKNESMTLYIAKEELTLEANLTS